jgi:hypothetical protein
MQNDMRTLYKVLKTDFNHLEELLNSLYVNYTGWSLYQIIPEHCYDGALAVVILQMEVEICRMN